MNGQLSLGLILDLLILCCCVYSCSSACRRRNCKTGKSRNQLNASNSYMNVWKKCVIRSDCQDIGFKKRFRYSPKMIHRLDPIDSSVQTSTAHQCVEQIAKTDMCFEVKNSTVTLCVFKNTDRLNPFDSSVQTSIAQQCIQQIAEADMCFEVKNSNSTLCVFKNTVPFFSNGIHSYDMNIKTTIGNMLCAACCHVKDKKRCALQFCSNSNQPKDMCKS